MVKEEIEYFELLEKIEIINENKRKKEHINISKVIHVFNLDNYETNEDLDSKSIEGYKLQYEKLVYMIKNYNITKELNQDIPILMQRLHTFLEKNTMNKKENLTIEIKEMLFDRGLNFSEMQEVLEEVSEGVTARMEIEENTVLTTQVDDIWAKFNKYQDNVEITRSKLPMWILNINYNDMFDNLLLDDKEKELFEKELKYILSKYSFSFASTIHDGKKTLLFDSKKSFKQCIEFIHSRAFVSMINHDLKLGIKIREKNFSIKVAKINKSDTVEEIVNKMNETYLKLNSFEEYDEDELMDAIKEEFNFIKKHTKKEDTKSFMVKVYEIVEKITSKYKAYIDENDKVIEEKKPTIK
jgi:hypothetical protein